MGICGACGHIDRVLVGRHHEEGSRQLSEMWHPMEWYSKRTRRLFQAEPLGFIRRAWKCHGVCSGLLEQKSQKSPFERRPKKTKKCQSRVIKSGAWYYLPKVSRSASRARNDTRVFSYFIGFRVFREMD